MNTWTPLWSGIVESSIWSEDDCVVKVFVTMLALKDSDHVCRFNAYQLGRKCNKSEMEVMRAIKVLESPDKKRVEKQAHEGRRIKRVEDGWLVLNGEYYRRMVSEEMKKARWRRATTAYRGRKKAGQDGKPASGKYLAAERRYEAALKEGDEERADRIAAGDG